MITSEQITVAGINSPVTVIQITNKSGYYVKLCNYGASVLSIVVPDKNGVAEDIVLGYANLEDHIKDSPYMGKTVGRFAGRIANGSFTLNGQQYNLETNNGENHLHGGSNGLSFRIWDTQFKGESKVIFTTFLKSSEDHYPGNIGLAVEYDWSDNNSLEISYSGIPTEDTIINLTNHAYFNLQGQGNILNHQLKLNAETYLPINQNSIPTGNIESVADTPMDFIEFHTIGEKMDCAHPQLAIDKGYNQCWIIKEQGDPAIPAAEIRCPANGRSLQIFSDYPGAVVYCGNYFDGSIIGKHHLPLQAYSGIAIEMQYYPNSPNLDSAPSCIVKKGIPFAHRIIYDFGII